LFVLFFVNVATASPSIQNIPASFYERYGLEKMPRIDYASMQVVNVRDFGAKGDGVQVENAVFNKALDALIAKGGGVFFIPKGNYLLEPQADDPKAYTMRGGKSLVYKVWPSDQYAGMSNIHFVGEGEESVLVYTMPPQKENFYNLHFFGMGFKGVNNVSLYNLSGTWKPFFRVRRAPAFGGITFFFEGSTNLQTVNVKSDQGTIGISFIRKCANAWAVDCDIRNTSADGLKFDDSWNMVAAYNYIEDPNDDAYSGIFYPTSNSFEPNTNNVFIGNTNFCGAFARGIIVGGDDNVIVNNWFERIAMPGFIYYGDHCNNLLLSNNTFIRGSLMYRSDMPQAAYARSKTMGFFGGKSQNNLISHNNFFGGENDGLLFFDEGGVSTSLTNVLLQYNRIEGSRGVGIKFGINSKSTTGDPLVGLVMKNNVIANNDGGSIWFGGNLSHFSASGNILTEEPVVTRTNGLLVNLKSTPVVKNVNNSTLSSSSVDGFLIQKEYSGYEDVYASIRREIPVDTNEVFPSSMLMAASEKGTRFNVKDFGAKGDGSFSDTKAFVSAMEALPISGGVIYIPNGTYFLTPIEENSSLPYTIIRHHLALYKKKNVHILGESESKTILQFTALDHEGLRMVATENASVRNLTVQALGKSLLRKNRSLIDVSGSRCVLVDHVTAIDGGGPSFHIDSSSGVRVANCLSIRSGMHGIRLDASWQVDLVNNKIVEARDNAILLAYGGSILREPTHVRVKGNSLLGTREGGGLTLWAGDDVVAEDNTISNTYLAGIYTYQLTMGYLPTKVVFTKNTLYNCGSGKNNYTHGAITIGPVLRKGDKGDYTITDNRIIGTPVNGIAVEMGLQYGIQEFSKEGFISLLVKGNIYSNVAEKNYFISPENVNKIVRYQVEE
jgi:polygalacturonase